MPYTIDDTPAMSKVCTYCRHWDRSQAPEHVCAAFPEGIPLEIWVGRNWHEDPFPGDHGIRFEKATPKPRPVARQASVA